MPVASKVSTSGKTVPFITVAQLMDSPISNQLQKLVPRHSDAQRDAELSRIITRVTAMINAEVSQNLAATVDVEVGQVRVDADGHLNIHTRANPIIDVLSIEVGASPTAASMTAVQDLSGLVLDPWRIKIPNYGRPGSRLWARFTYINGYPVTTLTVPAVAGESTITVKDPTGILPVNVPDMTGRVLTITDGRLLEQVTVDTVAGNVVTTAAPLLFDHKAGTGVNDLPEDIEEATLLLISRLHDTWSLSMGAITTDGSGAKIPGATVKRAMCDAAVMLNPYRRMW